MIPLLFTIIALCGVGAGGLWFARRKRDKRHLEALQPSLGLQLVPGTWGGPHRLVGTIAGHEMWVEGVPIRAQPFSPLCAHVMVKLNPLMTEPITIVPATEACERTRDRIDVGDVAFDKAIAVTGPKAMVLALLNENARAAVWEVVVTLHGRVVNGVIQCPVGAMSARVEGFQRVMTSVNELAGALSIQSDDIPNRLLTTVGNDLDPNVRLRNLTELLAQYPDTPEAGKATELARADDDQRVQLIGAKHLKHNTSFDDMGAIAASDAHDDVRLEALNHLVHKGSSKRVIPLLIRLLNDQNTVIQCAAVRGLSQLKAHACVDTLIELIEGAEKPVIRTIAEALGTLGRADVQPTLLQLLKTSDEATQMAALEALGHVGTTTVIERLTPYTKGVFTKGSLRNAACKALEQIDSRLNANPPAQTVTIHETPTPEKIDIDSHEPPTVSA